MTSPKMTSDELYNKYYDVIEQIANKNAHRWLFGFNELQDIKQQIRIRCAEVLDSYDESCGPIGAFLTSRLPRLNNLKRDSSYFCRWNPPCIWKSCVFYDVNSKTCMAKDGKAGCDAFAKYKAKFDQRLSVSRYANNGDSPEITQLSSDSLLPVDEDRIRFEFFDFVQNTLEGEILSEFLSWKQSGQSLLDDKTELAKVLNSLYIEFMEK